MSMFNYDELVQDALRGVVRQCLEQVAETGFSGNHHFYITFRTDHPDVLIPEYLKEQHPEEITIVLQYQFWNLEIGKSWFDVTLSFNDIHEQLHIPFSALVSFVDPSVKFGLQFAPRFVPANYASSNEAEPEPQETKPLTERKTRKESSKSTKKKEKDNIISLDAFRKK